MSVNIRNTPPHKNKQTKKPNSIQPEHKVIFFSLSSSCDSEEEEVVWELDGRLGVQVLARQESQFVGVLARRRNTNGAWPVPVQMAHFVRQPSVWGGKESLLMLMLCQNFGGTEKYMPVAVYHHWCFSPRNAKKDFFKNKFGQVNPPPWYIVLKCGHCLTGGYLCRWSGVRFAVLYKDT